MVYKIFITGATGYIGGALFNTFIERKDKYEVSVSVRSEDKGRDFAALGANVVIASLSDYDIISKAAYESDIVIHTADSFLIEPAIAITEGLRKRRAETGKVPIFIQTSGIALLIDNALGLKAGEKFLSDLDLKGINNLPLSAPHRPLDIYVSRYPQDQVRTAVVFPSQAYGIRKGFGNRVSLLSPRLVPTFIGSKSVHVVGKGVNKWSTIHIDDVASAYSLLVDRLIDGTASTGEEGFYFVENGSESMADIAKEIAVVLKKRGVIQDDKVTPYPKDFKDLPIFELFYGSNALGTADRLRQLGWVPKHNNFLEVLDEEAEFLLKNSK